MTEYEREVVLVFKTLLDMQIAVLDAAISVAFIVGDGTKALTRDEREVVLAVKRLAGVMRHAVDAAGLLLVDAGAKTGDAELWRAHDANLFRGVGLTALAIDAIGDVWFTERTAAKDFETEAVALKTAEWVADDLRLSAVPRVRWFSERIGTTDAKTFQSSPRTTGRVEPGVVWVHAGLSPQDAIRTVAHEGKHIRQHEGGANRGDLSEVVLAYGDRPSEAEAHNYGKLVALRLYGKYGHGPADTWRRQARSARYSHPTPMAWGR